MFIIMHHHPFTNIDASSFLPSSTILQSSFTLHPISPTHHSQIAHLRDAASLDVAQEVEACLKHLHQSLGFPSIGAIISREIVVQLFCLADRVFGCVADDGGGCPWPECPQAFDALMKVSRHPSAVYHS